MLKHTNGSCKFKQDVLMTIERYHKGFAKIMEKLLYSSSFLFKIPSIYENVSSDVTNLFGDVFWSAFFFFLSSEAIF